MSELDDTIAAAVLAQDMADVPLARVRFNLPDSQVLRYVNSAQACETAAGTYLPAPFELVLPADDEGGDTGASLRIDRIDNDSVDLLRTIEGIPTSEIEVYMASDPETPFFGPVQLQVQQATTSEPSIELSLGLEEDLINQSIPAQSVTPSNSPGYWGAA